ncbi:MAG: hypothetical protein QXM92_02490 [Candidatus Anstonellales archaeon]
MNTTVTDSETNQWKWSRRRKKYIIFSKAEEELLSFFVKERKHEVLFSELKHYCINNLDMNLIEFYKAYVTLLEKGILVEVLGSKEKGNYSRLLNIPAVVKYYLNLKYYDSAIILTALFKVSLYQIKRGGECEIALWDLAHLSNNIRGRYESSKTTFRFAIHELINKGYLTLIKSKRYKFNYKILSQELIEFLYLAIVT